MSERYQYDEKQLLDRGKSYRNGFIACIGLLLIFFLLHCFSIQIPYDLLIAVCIHIPVTVALITMIVKDAYDAINATPGAVIFTLWGGGGLCVLARWGIGLLRDQRYIQVIKGSIPMLIVHICWITCAVTYWAKRLIQKKKFKNEDI